VRAALMTEETSPVFSSITGAGGGRRDSLMGDCIVVRRDTAVAAR